MQTLADFFQRYATAYSHADLDVFQQLISLPSMLLAGDKKTILVDSDGLNQHVLQQIDKYRQVGITDVDFVLQHQLRLSEQLQFVSLYWRFYTAQGTVLFTCHTSYTVQKSHDVWQVVAIILDDEQAAYNRVAGA